MDRKRKELQKRETLRQRARKRERDEKADGETIFPLPPS